MIKVILSTIEEYLDQLGYYTASSPNFVLGLKNWLRSVHYEEPSISVYTTKSNTDWIADIVFSETYVAIISCHRNLASIEMIEYCSPDFCDRIQTKLLTNAQANDQNNRRWYS